MSLPAAHCRPAQATVKMVCTPELSLRGPNGAVAISGRQLRFRRGLPVIQLCTARLPRRFAPRNDTSGSAVVYQRPPTVELPCTGRSLSAATVKFDSDCVRRHSVYIGSAFPRLPRPLWGLAMTDPGTLRHGITAAIPATANGAQGAPLHPILWRLPF